MQFAFDQRANFVDKIMIPVIMRFRIYDYLPLARNMALMVLKNNFTSLVNDQLSI